MGDDLVAEQVEVDPAVGTAPLGAAEHAAIKGSGGAKIVDGKGEVEWAQRHAPLLERLHVRAKRRLRPLAAAAIRA